MAKLSWQTKETIKTILFIIIVIVLIATYGVYPLINSDTLFARIDLDEYNVDSLAQNDITPFENPTWLVDSFRVDTDALTSLACLSISDSLTDTTEGTVIVIPASEQSSTTQLALIKELINNSYDCITYDQRATGLSSGKHHGFGLLEAIDLQELISYLEIRGRLHPPLYIVGTGLGADAALAVAHDDKRIKKVVTIEPLLITDYIIEAAKEKHGSIWFPFYNSVMYWWYDKNAGYAPPYIELENIKAVACPTTLFTNDKTEAIQTLEKNSDETKLRLHSYKEEELNTLILNYLNK